MIVTLSKAQLEAVGLDGLKSFGWTEDRHRYRDSFSFDLSNFTREKCRQFLAVLQKHESVRGMKSRADDVGRWLEILQDSRVKCRKLSDFAPMLKQYLKPAPKHWVYAARSGTDDVYQPYYVSSITYTPPKKERGYYYPGYVSVTLYWEELGANHSESITFHADDVLDVSVPKALMLKGYQTETPELLAAYDARKAVYGEMWNKVGRQYEAVGTAPEEADREQSWYRRGNVIKLDRDGVPGRVVVDVLREDGTDGRSRRGWDDAPSGSFWQREGCDIEGEPDEDDDVISPGDEDDADPAETEEVHVPLSPAVMCFDLKRHTRVKVYVDQLTRYAYRKDLASKLILPDEVTNLVTLLVGHKGAFEDIVGGKSGGAIILCAGSPGTGKTLTSEIYSEAMERPLYSVQCSQLGTKPDDLEEELLKVFARAQRWNAILLLDEADVYVAARGRDLTQNAIVGVFLRVLEYYAGVLFLTTNRADLVDDAVASRCLARIDYEVPTPDNLRRIWRTLADNAGIEMSDAEVRKVSEKFPNLSGRDVKNLLKLGSMVATAGGGQSVTCKTIEAVKRFKPTSDLKVKTPA